MTDKTPNWDHTLIRKFNSTGHFRLLKQLRSELKANPIVRDPRLIKTRQKTDNTQN